MITTVTVNAAIDKSYKLAAVGLNQVNRVAEVFAVPGGKGINLAKVVQALGGKVTASGFLGGTNGQFIHQQLQRSGIVSDFVQIEGNSRETIAILDESGAAPTELLEPGPIISAVEQQQLVEKVAALAKTSTVVAFSGSLARGIAPDYYSRLIQAAKQQGAITILDTSGEPLAEGLAGKPHICKPNREELAQLLGYRLDSREEVLLAARRLLDKGIQAVIVSLDAEGSLAVTADAAWQITPPRIHVKNTVGCGDSLVAGIAFYLQQHGGTMQSAVLVEAIRLGTAAAASNATQQAAGSIQPEQVHEFLADVTIERL